MFIVLVLWLYSFIVLVFLPRGCRMRIPVGTAAATLRRRLVSSSYMFHMLYYNIYYYVSIYAVLYYIIPCYNVLHYYM